MVSKHFEVRRITIVNDLIELGKELRNGASQPDHAERYLKEGRIYFATNRTNDKLSLEKLLDENIVKYMIYVKDNKLAGGPFFSTYDIKFVTKEDAKEITKLMLDAKEIELDPVAQQYLDAK